MSDIWSIPERDKHEKQYICFINPVTARVFVTDSVSRIDIYGEIY